MNDDRDHEFTPAEIRATRLQVLLILLPMLAVAAVTVLAVVRAIG
jgi:hypothetical protein